MGPFLCVERDGPIVTMTLSRPDERNAISTPQDIEEIRAFCASMQSDPSVKAVIVTGAGSAFCAGGNVKDMRDRRGIFAGSPYDLRNRYRLGIQQIPLALYELEVPTIAAINGPAIGAGLDLACMCDVRIASDSAVFAESFVKLGIVPGDGGAWLLPRIVGNARASLLTLTGARHRDADREQSRPCDAPCQAPASRGAGHEAWTLAGTLRGLSGLGPSHGRS